MIPTRQLNDYVREQGLQLDRTELQIAVMTLQAVLEVDKPPVQRDLFRYLVPKLSEDGACSLVEELADEPYDLSPWFGGETEAARTLLTNFNALVESVNHKIGADWLGIYRRAGEGRNARLVKLAYQGLPSRAEFPLTEEFAAGSNNSRVGLTGWGVLIEDVAAWRADGGGYYECDPKVNSEVCLPIVDEHDRVLGILDAESSQRAYFDQSRLLWLAALAIVLAGPFAAMPPLEKQ